MLLAGDIIILGTTGVISALLMLNRARTTADVRPLLEGTRVNLQHGPCQDR